MSLASGADAPATVLGQRLRHRPPATNGASADTGPRPEPVVAARQPVGLEAARPRGQRRANGWQRGVLDRREAGLRLAAELGARIVFGDESCTTACITAPPQMPPMETTCGLFDGGPANDWCNGDGCANECAYWSSPSDVCWWEDEEADCETYGNYGECDDGICVLGLGETCSTCEDDCGPCFVGPACPNSVCEQGETWWSCPQDCWVPDPDVCGDEICGPTEEASDCPEDCTFSNDWCGDFEDCPEGWECINDWCVWQSNPLFKCCGGEPEGCANGDEVCNANEYCTRDSSVGNIAICKPRGMAGGVSGG